MGNIFKEILGCIVNLKYLSLDLASLELRCAKLGDFQINKKDGPDSRVG